jgi:hypothetical protein
MFFYSLLLWLHMYISVMSECHHLRAKVEELCGKMELMTEEGSKLSTKSGHMVVHFSSLCNVNYIVLVFLF